MKIDTSFWGEFSLKELGFKNYHGERLNKSQRIDGDIPFVTAGKINRGVSQYIETDRTLYQDAITVDMFGNCFFQKGNCTGDDNVYFFVNDELSDEHKLFISCSINAETSHLYAYKEQFRQPDADSLMVRLPVDSEGSPDWDYMQSAMGYQVSKEFERLALHLAIASTPLRKIDVSAWKEFRIGELFDLSKGTRLRSTDRIPGDIPYVGASGFNNGITHYISNDEHLNSGGVLTVCYNGPVGKTFYQPNNFWATDDVNILTPKCALSMETLLFIAPIIEKVGSNYAYTDKWKLDDMKASNISLPVLSSGEPDFAYMHSYMEELLEKQKLAFNSLCEIGVLDSIK